MSTSMTKGSPLKLMLRFALPLLMGNLLQQTYNIIDAAIVGQMLPDILALGIIVLCEITYLMARYLQQLLRQSL